MMPRPEVSSRGRTAGEPTVEEMLEARRHTSLFLTSLDREARRELSEGARPWFGPPGTVVMDQEGVSDTLQLLFDGAVQRRTTLADGRDVLLDIVGPVSLLNIRAPLLGLGAHHRLVTITPSRLLEIQGTKLRTMMRRAPLVGVGVARELTERVHRADSDHLLLAHLDATTRVIHRLVELGVTWGVRRDESLEIPLALSQEDLGAWAGVSRESAVKALHTLRRRGLVSTGRQQITIRDLHGLTRLAAQRGLPPRSTPVASPALSPWSGPDRP